MAQYEALLRGIASMNPNMRNAKLRHAACSAKCLRN
jgi:hypothetical protein